MLANITSPVANEADIATGNNEIGDAIRQEASLALDEEGNVAVRSAARRAGHKMKKSKKKGLPHQKKWHRTKLGI